MSSRGEVRPPGRLPLAALVLARRVRALVLATLVLTTVTSALSWWTGAGVTLPGLAGFGAHVAISLAAALPPRWQFAGDPVERQRRAARAMAVSFTVLAVHSVVQAAGDALAPAVPGGPLVGALVGVTAAVALPLLVAVDARTAREDGVPVPIGRTTTIALVAVLLVESAVDLTVAVPAPEAAGVSIAVVTVWAVIAVVAFREAWVAVRA